MTASLFRQQVLSRQQECHWGQSMGLNPATLSVLTSLIMVLVAAVAIFLVTGTYQRKVRVSGELVSDKGTIEVRAPAAGMISEVAAGTGERVGKGDLLLSVQAGTSKIQGKEITERLLAENRQQIGILESQVQQHLAEFRLSQEQADAEVHRLGVRLQQQEVVIENEVALNSLLERQLQRLQNLHKNSLVADVAVEQVRMDLLRQKSLVLQSRLEHDHTRQLLDKAVHTSALLAHGFSRKKSELKRSLSELKTTGVRLQAEQRLEVTSPVSGTVTVMLVKQGQNVQSGQPLLSLLVNGSTLQAQLRIPSRAAGFLEEGQQVSMRMDAFPFQKFGLQKARITAMSATVVTPAVQERASEPYYKVTATLEHQSVTAFGDSFALRPGMQLEADIVLENRSLLEWLLEPLLISGRLPGWM